MYMYILCIDMYSKRREYGVIMYIYIQHTESRTDSMVLQLELNFLQIKLIFRN